MYIVGVAAVCGLAACGHSTAQVQVSQDKQLDSVEELVIDIAETAGRHPAYASAAAGRVVLFDQLVAAPEGSDDFVAPTEVFVVNRSAREISPVDLPAGFALQAGVATGSGFVVVGGPCEDRRVSRDVADHQPVCPERVTTSYQMDWETQMWTQLDLAESLVRKATEQKGFFPYVPDGHLIQHRDGPAMLMPTSLASTELLFLDGGVWRSAGEFSAGILSPCSTGDAIAWLEQDLTGERVEQQRLVEVNEAGVVQRSELPVSAPKDTYGGLSVSTGCDGGSSILVHGGVDPTSGQGARAFRFVGGTWNEMTVPSEAVRPGSLGAVDVSSVGGSAVTFTRLTDDGTGLARATYIVPKGSDGFVEVPGGLGQPDRPEDEFAPSNLFFDPGDHTVISISRSNPKEIVMLWAQLS